MGVSDRVVMGCNRRAVTWLSSSQAFRAMVVTSMDEKRGRLCRWVASVHVDRTPNVKRRSEYRDEFSGSAGVTACRGPGAGNGQTGRCDAGLKIRVRGAVGSANERYYGA